MNISDSKLAYKLTYKLKLILAVTKCVVIIWLLGLRDLLILAARCVRRKKEVRS